MLNKLTYYKQHVERWFKDNDLVSRSLHVFLPIVLLSLALFIMLYGQLSTSLESLNLEGLEPISDNLLANSISLIILGMLLLPVPPIKLVVTSSVGFLVYQWLAGWIEAAYHLNDPDFKPGSSLFTHPNLQQLAMGIVFMAMVSYLAQHFFPRINRFRQDWLSDYLLAGVLAILIVSDERLLAVLKPTVEQLLVKHHDFSGLVTTLFLPLTLIFGALTYAFVSGWQAMMRNRTNLGLAVFSSFTMAVVLNYYLQLAYRGDGAYYGYIIVPGAMSFQIAFFTVAFSLAYLLLNRYLLTTLLVALSAVLVAVANTLKMSMRAEPLLITDFVWIQEIEFLTSFLTQKQLLQFLLLLGLLVSTYVFGRQLLLKGPIIKGSFWRLTVLVIVCLSSHQVAQVFRQEKNFKITEDIPLISKLNNQLDLNWLGFTMTARYKSLAFVWMKQLTKPIMEKPPGYSKQAILDLSEKYTLEAEKINQTRPNTLSDQTVIFLLSESFSNPENVPGVQLSSPAIPNILAVKERTTSGLMHTAFYGGGTANLEFQTLTGLPYANFSPSVSIAYTEVAPKMSYFPSISTAFLPENRIAIHPYGATNYNRLGIYKKLHFSRFFALSGSDDTLTDIKQHGVYTSDQTVYDNILGLLDPQEAQFFSVMTMQNHAPWVMPEPAELVAKSDVFSEDENAHLTDYTRLLYHTDQATAQFLKTLEGLEQTVTVVFYGDHLPGLYPAKAFESIPERQYQTDYFIWTNKKTDRKVPSSIIGANDFIAQLLEHTESKVTPYQALLTTYLHHISLNEGAELSEEQRLIDDELLLLQYDLTVGKGYITDKVEFFEGKSK